MPNRKRKNRSHNWQGNKPRIVFLVRSQAGAWFEVHPRLYLVHLAYGRLVQQINRKPSMTVRARVADGYDVYPDALTGALRLRSLVTEESYPIISSWRWVEQNFIFGEGRSTMADRKAAIDEECLFLNRPEPIAIASADWLPLWNWLVSIGYIEKDALPPATERRGQSSRGFIEAPSE